MESTSEHISMFLPSLRGGGAERVIVRLANELADRDYRIDIVLVHRKGVRLNEVSEAVNVVGLDTRRFLAAVPALVRYLRSSQPDVLLSTIDSANVAAITASKFASTDTRVVARISNMISAKHGALNHPKHLLVHLSARATYRHADHIIGVSEEISQDIITTFSVPADRTTTIYNPVVNETLRRLKDEPVAHPWVNGPERIVLGVGELSRQKDFGTLIRAFERADTPQDTKLLILGEGDQRTDLDALVSELSIQDRVDFPGFVDNPYAFMSKADLFVLSSRWEGCPNVLIEAMACGTPVLATDCPSGPSEILEGGAVAPLVPVGDVEAMSREITKGLADPPDTEPLLSRAESFTVSAITDQYLDVLLDS